MTERRAPTRATGWTTFWFAAVPAANLHRVRFLTGLMLCGWILSFAGHQEAFFSLDGWFDRIAYFETNRPDAPTPVPIGWSIFYLAGSSQALFDVLYWSSLIIVGLFTVGLAPRITGILTWVIVVSFLANPASSYDADFLLGILAFYLMIGYALLGLWSRWEPPIWQGWRKLLECVLGPSDAFIFSRWLGEGRGSALTLSYAANVTLRLIQIHFAIIIVTSGFHKLQMADWWAGVALWYPMHPPLEATVEQLMRERSTASFTLGWMSLISYVALAWQIFFPAFAWRGGWWRLVLISGAIVGWLGCLLILGLPLFGPIYLIACLSFLTADEWARLRTWFGARLGRGDAKTPRAAGDPHKIKVGIK